MRRTGRSTLLLTVVLSTILLSTANPTAAQTRARTRIVTNTELVELSVVVFDDKGAVATNLHKTDFRIMEDGVEQKILYCERERVPVSFVILADVSSSMTSKIPFVQEAAVELLEPPDHQYAYPDEYAVLGIETHVRSYIPFTGDLNDLERRLPLLLTATNGSTALFDGIYLGTIKAQQEASNKHRAMIIISDGGDNHSRYKLADVKHLLEEADMPVFAVMAGPSFELPPFLTSPRRNPLPPTGKPGGPVAGVAQSVNRSDYIGPAERRGPSNLKAIAEPTGGGVFTARYPEDLPRIVRTIALAVRYRYLLTYKPPRKPQSTGATNMVASDPAWHKIQLELYPNEKFKGYSLPYYKRRYRNVQ